MDWHTLTTVLPTAVSASFYAGTHTTFFWTMLRRRPAPLLSVRPWVSILKPLSGVDDDLQENLESFARLDYPAYEILFGVASASDPAVAVVESFLGAHPGLSARLVLTSPARGAIHNPKVAQLIDLTRQARGSVIVVSDANVRVPSTYLRSLVSELLRPGVGLVSSVICGSGEGSLGAMIENLQLNTYVAPAVVAAHQLGVRPATVGKSMAMRKVDLERAGGWESVGDVLAEDDALAQRFDALGFGVELSLLPIHNHNRTTTLQRSLERHARWAKMRRAITPRSFLLEPLLWPLFVATLGAVLLPSELANKIWLLALGLHYVGALLSLTLLRVKRPFALAALEPLRAAALFACWASAWMSRRVGWRGNAFVIESGSRLRPAMVEERGAFLRR